MSAHQVRQEAIRRLSKVMYGVARHFALALKVALEKVDCRGGKREA